MTQALHKPSNPSPEFTPRAEAGLGPQLTIQETVSVLAERETRLSRLLTLYIGTGLVFMLLPGTFLGVWNLISISNRQAALAVPPAWIQAHGHAQVFGWIGTFILGIGFYSIPGGRRGKPFATSIALATWALWTLGVTLRWVVNVYWWHWRWLLPASAVLELLAFVLFFRAVSGHKPDTRQPGRARLEPWILVVIAGTMGLMGALLANLGASFYQAFAGNSPAFSAAFDSRFLVLAAWGFMVPFVWGFSAKWLPIFLGLRSPRMRLLLAATMLNAVGVLSALFGQFRLAVVLLLAAAALSALALRLFEAPQQAAKTNLVFAGYPGFIRLAYVWLLIAASLGVWAAQTNSLGVWGASRHALTVGFIATMVFCIGQRVLPAFSGMRLLFSPRLMGAGLILLTGGCFLRVSAEILAYQGYLSSAWKWLPVSAIVELSAVTLFAVNIFCTFALRHPPRLVRPLDFPGRSPSAQVDSQP